ncbi:hypothetical protein LCGC14_1618910 [marine sediment metagenome]|uniref:Uncharacterized protein n=1 Tax=marine sediment metagenome TaxID=412755 RepID=A0A0F9ISZ7_9ZZZZ
MWFDINFIKRDKPNVIHLLWLGRMGLHETRQILNVVYRNVVYKGVL